jgi:hypothetical protein
MRIVLDAPIQAIEPLPEAREILPLVLDPLFQAGDSPAITGDDGAVGVRGLLFGLEFGTCGGESVLVGIELLASGLNILTVARERVLSLRQRDAVLSQVFAVTGDISVALRIGYHSLPLGKRANPEQECGAEDHGKAAKHGCLHLPVGKRQSASHMPPVLGRK